MLYHIISYRNPGQKIALEQIPVRELPEVGTRVASEELFIYVSRLCHGSTCKPPSIVRICPHPLVPVCAGANFSARPPPSGSAPRPALRRHAPHLRALGLRGGEMNVQEDVRPMHERLGRGAPHW